MEKNIIDKVLQINLAKRKKTYLEILKVNERETVMAELFAYFFDPNNEHGLNDVFIKALLKTKTKKLKEKSKNENEHIDLADIDFTDSKVKVEESTEKNKRLDILITSEKAKTVIGIEFKINHDLNNPLDEYEDLIDEAKLKNKVHIILSPYWKKPIGKAKRGNNLWYQVNFSDFIEKIKNEIIVNDIEIKQYYILNDLITTIENRGREVDIIKKLFKICNITKTDDRNYDMHLSICSEIDKIDRTEALKTVEKLFQRKIKELVKNKKGFKELNRNKERIQKVIEFKAGKDVTKIRLTFGGWFIEKWKNSELMNVENIGNYFTSIENLNGKIQKFIDK